MRRARRWRRSCPVTGTLARTGLALHGQPLDQASDLGLDLQLTARGAIPITIPLTPCARLWRWRCPGVVDNLVRGGAYCVDEGFSGFGVGPAAASGGLGGAGLVGPGPGDRPEQGPVGDGARGCRGGGGGPAAVRG